MPDVRQTKVVTNKQIRIIKRFKQIIDMTWKIGSIHSPKNSFLLLFNVERIVLQ